MERLILAFVYVKVYKSLKIKNSMSTLNQRICLLERKARRKFADRKTKFPNHYIRMKKKSSLLFVSFFALSLAGCTNDLQVPVENAGEALRDASADAVKLVTEFL